MDEVSKTTKRKEKIELVANMLQRAISTEELTVLCYFSIGNITPEYLGLKIGVGGRGLNRIVRELSGRSLEDLSNHYREDSDLGSLVEFALSKKRATLNQFLEFSSITPQMKIPITTISKKLREIAEITGIRSSKPKIDGLKNLIQQLTPIEAKYITRILVAETRTGFKVGMLEEAIAAAFSVSSTLVRRARMLLSDVGEVAMLAKRGVSVIQDVKIRLFRPISLMLAEKAETPKQALERYNYRASLEPKIDGIRAQVHIDTTGEVYIYSRLLEDISISFPELVSAARTLNCKSAILDGEIVAFIDNKPVFFQDLVKRKRKHKSTEYAEKIPCQLFVFDILLKDGIQLIDEPYNHRRKILISLVPNKGTIQLMKADIVSNVEGIENSLIKYLEQGFEGAMIKDLDSPYLAGRRGKHWNKIKQEMELDLVIVGAERGHGRRTGWLSDYFLAAYDGETGNFFIVGKTFKGLTDLEFQELTRVLEELTIKDEGWRVTVIPKVVVKCIFEGIQESKRYKSNLALRFARIAEIRHDKKPIEVDTLQTVKQMYERQFKTQARVESTKS